MTKNNLFVIAVIAIAMVMVAGCTSSTPAVVTAKDASCMVSIAGNHLEVANLGNRESAFTVVVASYDARGVKLDEHPYNMPSTEPGGMSQRTLLFPSGTASYEVEDVATTIGDKTIRVYFLYKGVVRS